MIQSEILHYVHWDIYYNPVSDLTDFRDFKVLCSSLTGFSGLLTFSSDVFLGRKDLLEAEVMFRIIYKPLAFIFWYNLMFTFEELLMFFCFFISCLHWVQIYYYYFLVLPLSPKDNYSLFCFLQLIRCISILLKHSTFAFREFDF